jgi:glycosyltransferase involved in cell wall biosynthesis
MFSDSWVKECLSYGPVDKIGVIEHAVDSNVFSRIDPAIRDAARTSNNIPSDAIVFLNANRNSIRKRIDLAIMSFVELIARDITKPYYMMMVMAATPDKGGYYDLTRIYLAELAEHGINPETIGKRLIIVDTGANPLSDQTINEIYNITDIGINTSDGEGFGLCQLEHLYVGAPQIVTDVGAYSTFLTPEVSEIVPARGYSYFSVVTSIGFKCPYFSHIDIADAMQKTIETIDQRREAIKNHVFKTWPEICANWLTDIRNECN